MEHIRITLSVQKDRCADFEKYLNDMVFGLRCGAIVHNVCWLDDKTLLIEIGVNDKDEKWGSLSELLTWVYAETYNNVFDVQALVCL